MDQTKIDDFRRHIESERTDIVTQLTDMGIDPKTGMPSTVDFEQGFADSGQAAAEKVRVLSIAEGLMDALREIEAAYQRMDKGTFGRCESCGTEIPAERLEALPYARYCVACKKRLG